MIPDRKCLTCGERFAPKSEKNTYCCRKCFKKANWHFHKARELTAVVKFPTFLCPVCHNTITLNFDPVKENNRWLHYECPECATPSAEFIEAL